MSEQRTSDISALVAPLIAALPNGSWPRFLAMLERVAGDRYRGWAAELPQHADVLLACAAREDEVADRVELVWQVSDAALAQMAGMLPGARDAYAHIIHGLTLADQLAFQAGAELQGEAAWGAIAAGVADARVIAELTACAALERASADALRPVIAALTTTPPTPDARRSLGPIRSERYSQRFVSGSA